MPLNTSASTLAVPDMSLARLPGQFKLSVTPDRQWVEHEIAAWSVGLRWLTFGFGNTPYDPESPLFVSKLDEEYLATVEQQSFEDWMQPYYPRHLEMHELATSLGLEPGGEGDLPIERVMIDRLLKDMLRGDGVDLHGPAEKMASEDYYLQFLCNCMDYMQTSVGNHRFQLTQMRSCLPELSADLPIGKDAIYHGFALDVKMQLPHVLMDSLADRRLGDIVSTGLADLDQRVITGVVTDRDETYDDRLPDGWTRLQLSRDLVPLGQRTG